MDLHSIGALIAGIFSIFKTFQWVKEGEIGTITTFGKASRDRNGNLNLLKPGFKILIPFIQQINKVHIVKNTDTYEDLLVTLKSGLTYKFNAFVIYHVKSDAKSINNVIFVIEDYKEYISMVFEKTIQDILQIVERIEPDKLNAEIKGKFGALIEKEGICVDDCGLISFAATDASQQLFGINYKLEVAANSTLDPGIIAAAIGATPVVSVEKQPVKKNLKDEDEDEGFLDIFK